MKVLLYSLVLFSIFIAIQAEESKLDQEVSQNEEPEVEAIPNHLIPKKTTKRGAYGYGYGYGLSPYSYGDFYGFGYPYRSYSYSPYRFLYPYYGGYGGHSGYGGYGGYGYYGW